MDINQQKEQFSKAYIKAVATVAGYAISDAEVDDDSVDVTISQRGGRGSIRSPKIDAQLKCTSRSIINNGRIAYPLKIKNYNDLRPVNVQVPRILIIVIVPDNVEHWLTHTEEKLSLYHCGYWYSLRGLPETQNEGAVTISFPSTQCLTSEQLKSIMERVGNGGVP